MNESKTVNVGKGNRISMVWTFLLWLTGHMGWIKGVKGEGEDVLCVALLPEFGACIPVPQNDVVGRMDGQQEVTRRILIPQPVQVWQMMEGRQRLKVTAHSETIQTFLQDSYPGWVWSAPGSRSGRCRWQHPTRWSSQTHLRTPAADSMASSGCGSSSPWTTSPTGKKTQTVFLQDSSKYLKWAFAKIK